MNSNGTHSIFDRKIDPLLQAGLVFILSFSINAIAKLFQITGLSLVSGKFFWMTATVFLLLFAIFNSLFSFTSTSSMKYWGRSVYGFLGLAFLSGFVAYLFSSMSISEAGSFRWIYFVVTLCYIVFLTMVNLMRKIIEFAQRDEFNARQ